MSLKQTAGQIINVSQRRPSTGSFITAWQIESTLSNMEEFIQIIQQCKKQRSELRSIFPQISRIKKINQEKQIFSKDLKHLENMNSPLHNISKQGRHATTQTKQNILSDHQKRLKKIVQNIKNQTEIVQKQINSLRKQINEAKIQNQNRISLKKTTLISQLNSSLSTQINFVTSNINQKENLLKIPAPKSIYQPFLEQYIDQKLFFEPNSSKFTFESHQNKSSLIAEKLPKQILPGNKKQININSFQTQLGEIKCKLLSLQDKKRKMTVKSLLKNKRQNHKQVHGCGFQQSSNKPIGISKLPVNILQSSPPINHPHSIIQKHQDNFIASFFSIFSNVPSVKKPTQQFQQENRLHIKLSQKKLPKGPERQIQQQDFQSSLKSVEDVQTKLRMIEINSQILQLRQHISIMVNQNIFDEIIACVMKLQKINQELEPLLGQLIEVVQIYGIQFGLGIKKHNTSQDEVESQLCIGSQNDSAPQIQGQKYFIELRQNQNLKFVMRIIGSKFIQRAQIAQRLFFPIRYSIEVAMKYLRKRYSQIKDQFQQFIESDLNREQKIKATQAQKSRPQVLIISSALEYLSSELNQVIQKLLKLQQFFKTQHKIFSNYFEIMSRCHSIIQKDKENPDQSYVRQSNISQFSQVQLKTLQDMLLSPQAYENDHPEKNHINRKRNFDDLKTQIKQKFFHFYGGLIDNSLKILSLN